MLKSSVKITFDVNDPSKFYHKEKCFYQNNLAFFLPQQTVFHNLINILWRHITNDYCKQKSLSWKAKGSFEHGFYSIRNIS